MNLDVLTPLIREAGRPVHVNVLVRAAVRARLEAGARTRRYAPGAHYRAGETILFDGQRATVKAVQETSNPVQGPFAVLTLLLPDGAERLVAAEVPGAPAEDREPVTETQVEQALRAQGAEARQSVQAALAADPRFVACQTLQGDLWCLADMLPRVRTTDLQLALAALPDELLDGEPVSCTTEELVRRVWGLVDDGGDDYALHAFALRRALDAHAAVVNLGDRWASAQACEAFTARPTLEPPQMPTQVTLPEGVEPATEAEVEREQRRKAAGEEEEPEAVELADEDLETWRRDHPAHAVLTLRARHYYEGWLPLSRRVRRLFPPLACARQEVVFHHHLGDEPASFRAWVDRERGRVWMSPEMYETFRRYRIYPGARLRLSARNEREFDLAPRETDRSDPVRVWRMWLGEDGQIEYEEFEEPRRYDMDDDVYVADVRFEDQGALFRQAEEVGNCIFGLMYAKAVEWWEAGGRKDLTVTADQLFEAVHFDEWGRMASKATIGWELWRRLAFAPVGGGRRRFRPEFGDRLRYRPPSKGPPAPSPASPTLERTRTGQLVAADLVPPGPLFEQPPRPSQLSSPEREATAHEPPSLAEPQSDIEAEFRQIQEIVRTSLVGRTIYTLAWHKPNRITEADQEGLTVATKRGVDRVRWEGIKEVYEELYCSGKIEIKDVQEGAFRSSAGFRVSFIFALLSQFAHIGAFKKPRIHLTYHRPEEAVRLREATREAVTSVGASREPEPTEVPASPNAQPLPSSTLPSLPPLPPTPPKGPGSSAAKRGDDMQTKTLFSRHYLQHRLPDHPEWSEDPRPAFDAVRALWHKARQYGDSWNEAQTEDEFVRPVLEALGWSFIVQPKSHRGGRVTRPDYALFADRPARDAAYPHQGHDDAFYSHARAIAEAKYWGRPLSQQDRSGRQTWKAAGNPSHQMVSYLVGTRVPWGILTNGRAWRLYSREVSSTASEFYEVDLGLVFDFLPPAGEPSTTQWDQFRRWWLFFRRDAFLPDAQGRSFVQRVHEGSATYAREISDKLKELVFDQVMPEIAGGFVAYRYRELSVREETEESLRQIYQASLSLLYKLLFLLYAEARGLLPVDNPGYREQSLTALAQWAARRLDKDLPLSDATHATPRYDALLALFHRIDQGDPSLGVPRYNGGLFNPASPENQFLETHRLSDRAVARAVDILVRDAGQPVDYAYIGVRNLGSIYEGLLENRLVVTRLPKSQKTSEVCQVELVNDKGERKATGSYYTPDYIVAYIVEHTLDPILDERDGQFRAAMDRCAGLRRQLRRQSDATTVRLLREQLDEAERNAREAFLGIKVCDPATGSGHFLVNAVDHLTDGIIRRMQVYHDEHPDVPWAWNPIQRLIERVRGEILAEMDRQGIAVDPGRLDDTALLTRLVMKRCIYGVDLNRMAVELAKVSLWLHSFTVGAPLSFLDHHLRWGNSLIGTDVRTVEQAVQMTEAGQLGLFEGPFAGLLDLTRTMLEVVERADATLADVRQSAEDFDLFQQQLTPYKQVLDLWVSQYFGNPDAYELLTLYGADVLPALRGEKQVADPHREALERARELWREKRFFHWDLEFPEVFVDLRRRDWAQNPGFDAVIGNPPYLSISRLPSHDRRYLRSAYSEIFTGNSDILYYFLALADKLPVKGGWLGLIVARYFQEAKYAQPLRTWLARQVQLRNLVDFKNFQVFGRDVSILASIVIFNRALPDKQASTLVLRINDDQASEEKVAQALLCQDTSLFDRFMASLPDPMEGMWRFSSKTARIIDSKLEHRSVSLCRVAKIVQSMQTGRSKILAPSIEVIRQHSIEPGLLHPIAKAGSIGRYFFEELDRRLIWTEGVDLTLYPNLHRYLLPYKENLASRYDIRNRGANWWEISNPRNADLFLSDSPRILVPFIATGNKFCVDYDRRLNDGGDLRAVFFSPDGTYLPEYTCSLLNSTLLEFYHLRHTKLKRGGYYEYFENQLARLPIRRIAFTTPPDERARLVGVGTAEAAEFIAETAERGASAPSASFSAFSDSALGHWLHECLSSTHAPDPALVRAHNADPLNADWQLPDHGPVEQSDVVHDLLAHLAEQMIAMNREKQAEVKGLLAWLEREIGAPIDDLTRKTHLRNYLGDYQKGETHLALDDVLDILRRNRRRLRVDPAARAFQERLAREYQASLDKLLPLKARLAATDRLIDLVIYRLYGLTEEEVAVVERRS